MGEGGSCAHRYRRACMVGACGRLCVWAFREKAKKAMNFAPS
jgi:hypothetical protein